MDLFIDKLESGAVFEFDDPDDPYDGDPSGAFIEDMPAVHDLFSCDLGMMGPGATHF